MHVSVLELHAFVTRGESSREFEAHVNGCAACARKLSSFARRVVEPAAVMSDDEPRRLGVLVMAFAACFAVMLVQAVRVPVVEVKAAPEGVHGVAEAPVFDATWEADVGSSDSGTR